QGCPPGSVNARVVHQAGAYRLDYGPILLPRDLDLPRLPVSKLRLARVAHHLVDIRQHRKHELPGDLSMSLANGIERCNSPRPVGARLRKPRAEALLEAVKWSVGEAPPGIDLVESGEEV